MSLSVLPFTVRCTVCHFCTSCVYALEMHNCDNYMIDTYSHCPGFPICDHTADTCADYAEHNQTSASYRGYFIEVRQASVWVGADNVRTSWVATIREQGDLPLIRREIKRTDAHATLTAARKEIDYVLMRNIIRAH